MQYFFRSAGSLNNEYFFRGNPNWIQAARKRIIRRESKSSIQIVLRLTYYRVFSFYDFSLEPESYKSRYKIRHRTFLESSTIFEPALTLDIQAVAMNAMKAEWRKREMPMVAIATTDKIETICIEHRRRRVYLIISPTIFFSSLLCNERFRIVVVIDPTKELLTFIYWPVDSVCSSQSIQYVLHVKRHAKSKNCQDAVNEWETIPIQVFDNSLLFNWKWSNKLDAHWIWRRYTVTVFLMFCSVVFSFNWPFQPIQPEIQGCGCVTEGAEVFSMHREYDICSKTPLMPLN